MESEFLTTASSFWRMGENADRRDVFFAVVDYPTAVTTFQKVCLGGRRESRPTPPDAATAWSQSQHKFTSVPMVVHHEPSTTGLSGKARYVIKPGQVYQVTDTGIDAESLARFVKQHVRAEVRPRTRDPGSQPASPGGLPLAARSRSTAPRFHESCLPSRSWAWPACWSSLRWTTCI